MTDTPYRADDSLSPLDAQQAINSMPNEAREFAAPYLVPGSLLMRINNIAIAVACVLGAIYAALFLQFGRISDGIGVIQCAATAIAFVIARRLAGHGHLQTGVALTVGAALITGLISSVLNVYALPISVLIAMAVVVVSAPYFRRQQLRHTIYGATASVLAMCIFYIGGSGFQFDRTSIGRIFLSIAVLCIFGIICRMSYLSHAWLIHLIKSLNEANDGLRSARDTLEAKVGERTQELTHANERLTAEVAERTQAEVRLRAAERATRDERDLAQLVMKSMSEGLVICDGDMIITYANPALANIVGMPVEAMVGRSVLSFFHAEDVASLGDAITNLGNGRTTSLEARAQRADGSTIWIHASGGQHLHHAHSAGYLSVVTDITARREVEQRLRLLESAVANANDGVLVTDATPTDPGSAGMSVVYANNAFVEMTGYAIDEILGCSANVLMGEKTNADTLAGVAAAQREGRAISVELQNYRKDGSTFWVQWTISAVKDEAGQVLNWIALMRDITQRKQEEALLRRQNGFLAALHEMTVGLINRFESEHLFDTVVERVCRLMNCEHGYIALVSDDGTELVTAASFGDIDITAEDRPRRKGEGLSGKVWQTGNPIWLSNYGQWRGHVPDLMVPYPVAVAPLKSEGRVVGVIGMVRANEAEPFADDEIDLLLRFGQLAALIYVNTRLYRALQRELVERGRVEEQLRKQNAYLAALHDTTIGLVNRLDVQGLLQSVLSHACALLDTPHAFLDLIDASNNTSVSFAGVGRFNSTYSIEFRKGEGLVGQVWEQGGPVNITDYNNWPHRSQQIPDGEIYAALGVPLKSADSVVGVIGMVRTEPGRTFTPEEQELLSRFAQLASITYDNAKLYQDAQREIGVRRRAEEALRRQTEYLAALNDTTLGLVNRLNLSDLLQAIVARAVGLIDTPNACIDIFSEDGQLDYSMSRGTFDEFDHSDTVSNGDKGLFAMVFRTGKPVVVESYDEWSDRESSVPFGLMNAMVGVPLTSAGRVVGVLAMAYRERNRVFGPEEVEVLSRLAQLASVAYDNARLYEELRANEQALEQRVAVRTSELTSALEENEKLRARSIQAAAAAERSRLARELHDSVSQAIYGIALGARTMQQLAADKPSVSRIEEPLTYIVSLADAALAEIRALIFELRPESLEKEGILAAIRKQADALRVRYGLRMELDLCEREPDISLDAKEALYRIALEGTHNTVKHANATTILIRLREDDQTIRLDIADDGGGFDPTLVGAGHLGLKTMQERVDALQGEIRLDSAFGRGTTISVVLPRQARAAVPTQLIAPVQS